MPAKPNRIRPALLGGLTIALLWVMPIFSMINCFCCAGVILGGFISVSFYRKNMITMAENLQVKSPIIELNYSDGIILGVMSGAFGAIFSTISNAVLKVYTKQSIEEMIDRVMEIYPSMPAELEDALMNFSANYNDLFFITMSLIFSLVIFCIFGALGGMIAVSILNRKKRS